MDERLSSIEESLRTLVLNSETGRNSQTKLWSPKPEEGTFVIVREDISKDGSDDNDSDDEISNYNKGAPGSTLGGEALLGVSSKATRLSSPTNSNSRPNQSRRGTAFEGETSMKAHTTRATQVLKNTLFSDNVEEEQTPEMTAAFADLRKLLAAQNKPLTLNELRFPGQEESAELMAKSGKGGVELSELELPPPEVVLAYLQKGQREYHFA